MSEVYVVPAGVIFKHLSRSNIIHVLENLNQRLPTPQRMWNFV